MVKVVSLKTGNIWEYSHCKPEDAVIKCYLYNNGNRNTWEYDDIIKKEKKNLVYGRYTVSYHDFVTVYTTGAIDWKVQDYMDSHLAY